MVFIPLQNLPQVTVSLSGTGQITVVSDSDISETPWAITTVQQTYQPTSVIVAANGNAVVLEFPESLSRMLKLGRSSDQVDYRGPNLIDYLATAATPLDRPIDDGETIALIGAVGALTVLFGSVLGIAAAS